MNRIVALLLCYAGLGVLAFLIINRKREDGEARSRWMKLAVYICITTGLTAAFLRAPMLANALAILIGAGGFIEVLRLPRLKVCSKVILLLIYSLIAFAFCLFVRDCVTPGLMARIYVVVLSFDGFSQIWGQLIGGRKIAPRISPGKTYAGLIGGSVMGVATAAYLEAALNIELVLAASLICMLSFTGDMLASSVKRFAGVKDYSSVIPGHGGILDRFDSLIFTAAALEVYFRFA